MWTFWWNSFIVLLGLELHVDAWPTHEFSTKHKHNFYETRHWSNRLPDMCCLVCQLCCWVDKYWWLTVVNFWLTNYCGFIITLWLPFFMFFWVQVNLRELHILNKFVCRFWQIDEIKYPRKLVPTKINESTVWIRSHILQPNSY